MTLSGKFELFMTVLYALISSFQKASEAFRILNKLFSYYMIILIQLLRKVFGPFISQKTWNLKSNSNLKEELERLQRKNQKFFSPMISNRILHHSRIEGLNKFFLFRHFLIKETVRIHFWNSPVNKLERLLKNDIIISRCCSC